MDMFEMLFGKGTPKRVQIVPTAEPAIPPIAKLTPLELSTVNTLRALVREEEMRFGLMKDGLNLMWMTLKEKYSLPQNFVYDDATGEIRPEVTPDVKRGE